ncbi:MAG: ABC transporter permease [Chloroflexi bacterium]|nr:ABC transporter permease [Chloroflexota bacterium]
MQAYVLRRLLLSIPTLLGITLLIFFAMRVIPGDPLAMIQGEGANQILTPEQVEDARRSLGLNRPLHEQYLSWMSDVLRGDLGRSFWLNEPIRDVIVRRGIISGQVAVMALLLSLLIGVPTGLISALRRNTGVDYMTRLLVIFFTAIPPFWFALLIVLVQVLVFSWRPPIIVTYLWDDPIASLQMTAGPAFVLGLAIAAVTARMTRSTTLEVASEDYVRTARAKGVSGGAVVWRHVLRNALLPVVTFSSLSFGALLGGSVAVEQAFGVPGLGVALVFALSQRDWMMIQNLVLVYGCVFVLVNLITDLLYGWLDPRIRFA